jgi:hypothetical protein
MHHSGVVSLSVPLSSGSHALQLARVISQIQLSAGVCTHAVKMRVCHLIDVHIRNITDWSALVILGWAWFTTKFQQSDTK